MSPTPGAAKRLPMRLTITRSPTASVGSIEPLGMRYGLTTNAWTTSAMPSATATTSTSSSSELEPDLPFTRRGSRALRPRPVRRPRLREPRPQRRRREPQRPREAPRSPHRARAPPRRRPRSGASTSGSSGAGAVQQLALDDLLGTDRAALADAGALADAVAQVVELRAPHVAASRHLDLLDLRRVQRERALDADAERLLADREGLAHAVALALDDDALEDLRAAARALDDLEVDAHAIARVEGRDAAQLGALEAFDNRAHGVEVAALWPPAAQW